MPDDHPGLARPSAPTRRTQFRLLTLVVLVAVSACLLGLWRALTAKPTRASGVVTYLGQPVGSAVIRFQSRGPVGYEASGAVVGGRFTVPGGLIPGDYAVSIRDKSGAIPARYGLPATSGISVRVIDAGTHVIDFELH